jgi:hypothetical protein
MHAPRRVVGLLTKPSQEWLAIAAETPDIGELYRGYVVLLAAIPSGSIVLGLLLAGGLALGGAAIGTAVTAAMASYAMALAIPFAAALVIEHLGPRFKSDGSTAQAFSLVAHASTPMWLAGAFYVSVSLSPLVLVGVLYSIYLFFTGLTPLMATPPEQRVPFTLVVVMAILVLQILFGAAASAAKVPYYGF